jgi:broad specificity phosphatase PhoE
MHVYFVRHGETEANVENLFPSQETDIFPLTERGREQAQSVADRVSTVDFERAFSSDLLRAVETAQIILGDLELELETTPLLREHDVGELVGRSDEEAWNQLRDYFLAWMGGDLEVGPAGGESMADLQGRFFQFIDELLDSYRSSDSSFLVVAHAGLLWSGLPFIFDNVDLEFVQAHGLNNGSLIVGQFQDGHWTCLEWDGELLSVDKM